MLEEQNDKVLVIGENIKVRRFARYDTGLSVPYVHMGGRIAVLVNLETESTDAAVIELGKDIAMQIAALNPTYMDKSDVSEEFIAKEKGDPPGSGQGRSEERQEARRHHREDRHGRHR